MKEIWKPVPETDGLIEVSNFGRARSWKQVGRWGGIRDEPVEILTGRPKKSYKMMNIEKDKVEYLHRIVAKLFIPNPEGKKCINHKDGDKLNNHVDNLEWCSKAENNRHAFKTGLIKKESRLSDIEAMEIHLLYNYTELTSTEIGDIFGISRQHAYGIGTGRSLQNVL